MYYLPITHYHDYTTLFRLNPSCCFFSHKKVVKDSLMVVAVLSPL